MREWFRTRMAVLSTWERSVVAALLTVTPLALISGQWLSIVSLLAVTALAVEANYWYERCRRGQVFTDLGIAVARAAHAADCAHCHDHVRPGHLCPECGLYDPNEEDDDAPQ